MNTIKVKEVKAPSGECSICAKYYRERAGMPLLSFHGGEWVVCSKDGEPSHVIDAGEFKVEVCQ